MKETVYFKTKNKEIDTEFIFFLGFILKVFSALIINYVESSQKSFSEILTFSMFLCLIIFLTSFYYLLYFLIGDYRGKMIFYEDFVEIKIPFNKFPKIKYSEILYIELNYERFSKSKIPKIKKYFYIIHTQNGKKYKILTSEKERIKHLKDFEKYRKDGVLTGNESLENLKEREKYLQNNPDFPDYSLGKAMKKLQEKIHK